MKVFVFLEQVKNLREGITMKKIVIATLIIFAFSWVSVVSAGNKPSKESPESSVTCLTYFVYLRSISETINVEQCKLWPDQDSCASCLISLEDQGCKIVDYFVSHPTRPTDGNPDSEITYLLSCDGR